MAQGSINQRLKILIESLDLSTRGFSKAIGVSDTNTRNYLDRGSKPNSDYLEKIMRRFERVNSQWLLLGQGEMFLSSSEPASFQQKNSGGNNIGQNTGTGTVTQTHNRDTSSELQQQLDAARREIELLKSQLGDKDRIIQLLEMQLKK